MDYSKNDAQIQVDTGWQCVRFEGEVSVGKGGALFVWLVGPK